MNKWGGLLCTVYILKPKRKAKNTYFVPYSGNITEDRYKENILFLWIQVIYIRKTCRNERTVYIVIYCFIMEHCDVFEYLVTEES